MSFSVRDGSFDLVIVAGPRLDVWPSVGIRALSSICAEMGLKVGVFGGEAVRVRGVVPLPGTGGIAIVQDSQNRAHRIRARAVVKVVAPDTMPDPFPGWRSPGLLPFSTALRLRRESEARWDPATVILGTGNRALRFGSDLLEAGVPEVYCVESYSKWGNKHFPGWEVEKRRFDMIGGKLLQATPLSLTQKSALLWSFRLQDAQGIRVLEVARVISAGPFRDLPLTREHPAGSLLFEFEQSALATKQEDVEGWISEEERGVMLAVRVVRTLVPELGERKEELEQLLRKAKARLKKCSAHREEPFYPQYQGKWLQDADSVRFKEFSGVPRVEHQKRAVAALECVEEIPCNVCEQVCPEKAIDIGRLGKNKDSFLLESRCTGCGICVSACPSGAAILVHAPEDRPTARVTLPWRGAKPWKQGEYGIAVNRRGDNLGSARVMGIKASENPGLQLLEVEVPIHLAADARGLRRPRRAEKAEDDEYLESVSRLERAAEKIEVTLNGEKRLIRDGIPITVALFETGRSRPEDALFCRDGSCGLCQVQVDGVKKLACQTTTHRGMAIRTGADPSEKEAGSASLCPCQKVSVEQVVERTRQGKLQSPEAVLAVTGVGEGKCHGQLCIESFRRVLMDQGLKASQWTDWRFPWSDWVLKRN